MADQAEKLRMLARQLRTAPPQAASPAEAAHKKQPLLPERCSRVIAITSGKGGVGKTNVSINLSLALRKMGHEVILFDADLGMANADVLLGFNPRYNLQHFIQGLMSLQEVISEGPMGLKVIASGNGISRLADLSAQERERILSHFELIEDSTDFIIVDTGAGVSRNVISFVKAADECLVVTTPEPTARLDAYGLIKILAQEDFEGDIKIVVNMVETEKEGEEIGHLMEMMSKRFLEIHVDYLGCIRRDRVVLKAVQQQNPFLLSHPDSQAAAAIEQLARRIVGGEKKKGLGLKGFFRKLGGSFASS